MCFIGFGRIEFALFAESVLESGELALERSFFATDAVRCAHRIPLAIAD
jgi:hypothetical protein